ncbi:hypothetical protein HLB44_36275 [Aquincola sp. S2]|uniref:Uncharacterized protein n=1 Tax=Pseudaquabacterium terrae TaxID=2732868 RepID=A0ABX2EUT1_9BURK|nr:hypothetical protein [Aquabacterium terrae]NRF72421.1 hypothetical protein [Aquabacterium terrae]
MGNAAPRFYTEGGLSTGARHSGCPDILNVAPHFRLRETIADSPEIDALSLARFDNEGLRISPVNKDEPGNDAALLNRLATLIAAMDKRDEL